MNAYVDGKATRTMFKAKCNTIATLLYITDTLNHSIINIHNFTPSWKVLIVWQSAFKRKALFNNILIHLCLNHTYNAKCILDTAHMHLEMPTKHTTENTKK